MGTLHSDIMLGLFKDFGKKATDLNKKEFVDDKWSKKATVKSSSGNVKFEGSVTCAGTTESKLDFKDAQMEIKNKIDNAAVYTVEATAFKVMDGLDAKLIFATPKSTDGNKGAFFSSVSLGSEYATADINSSSALKINFDTAGKDAGAFSVTGCQFGSSNAYKVQDDLVIGFKFDKATMKGSKFEIGEMKFGSTYTCGDMLLMAAVDGSFKDGGFKAGALSTSLFQQVDKATAVAAELSLKDGGMSAKFGTSYKLSEGTTLKTKLTAGCAASELDFAWCQKLSGNSSFTFAQKLGEGSDAKYSFAYTLDA